jgi:putative beta barrel porin BBP7
MVVGQSARLFSSSPYSRFGGERYWIVPVIILATIASICFLTAPEAAAQRANLRPSQTSHSANGPNPVQESDLVAGQLLDSIFDPETPNNPLPAVVGQVFGRTPTHRSSLRGRLVRNPDTSDGSPPFVIVDRYGGIQRYVEPASSVDLEAFEGRIVGVKRDTGDTLLASQLDLPRITSTSRGNPPGLQLAAHQASHDQEFIDPGEVVDEQPLIIPEGVDPVYLDDGLDFGGCPQCGQYPCQSDCTQGIRDRSYVRAEYLQWWLNGFDTPPLVTASNPADGGVLPNEGIVPNDNPSTRILYGGDELLDGSRSGGRIRLGTWLGRKRRWALEGDYLSLGSESASFSASGYNASNGYSGDGSFLSRPFFDFRPANPGLPPYDGPQENAEAVYSNTIEGSVTVSSASDFQSAAILLRRRLCCAEGCTAECGDCVDCSTGVGCGDGVGTRPLCSIFGLIDRGTRKIDFLVGLRYARLDESLGILEDLEVYAQPNPADPPIGTTFEVSDLFSTSNDFAGGELGFLWQWQHQRWSFDLLSKLAIGNNRQKVAIRGYTIQDNILPADDGGLLALTSNIGTYQRDEFSLLPELGLTLGYQLTPRLRLTTGYTVLYWMNVVRPGDQIDREINSTLLPGAGAVAIPQRPHFVYRNSNLRAQGIHLGAEYLW